MIRTIHLVPFLFEKVYKIDLHDFYAKNYQRATIRAKNWNDIHAYEAALTQIAAIEACFFNKKIRLITRHENLPVPLRNIEKYVDYIDTTGIRFSGGGFLYNKFGKTDDIDVLFSSGVFYSGAGYHHQWKSSKLFFINLI